MIEPFEIEDKNIYISCNNVADGVLVKSFQDLKLKESGVYLTTYDKELKDRFR